MTIRFSGLPTSLAFVLLAVVAAAPGLRAQQDGPVFVPVAEHEGVLKGVIDRHDGKPDWIAVLKTDEAAYLIVGPTDTYQEMKRFAGKKVVVKGGVATYMRMSDGEVIKLEGRVGNIRYQGNLEIASVDEIRLAGERNGPESALVCRIRTKRFLGKRWQGALVVVEVTNKGKVALEPAAFTVSVTPNPQRLDASARLIRRVTAPQAGNLGRPVAPGKKMDYWFMVACESAGDRLAVEVAESFEPAPGESVRPEIEIGPFEDGRFEELGTEHPATSVRLVNHDDRDLDLVFLASFRRPTEAVVALQVRLAAGETRKLSITHLPVHGLGERAWQWPGAAVDKLELVDWCGHARTVDTGAATPAAVDPRAAPTGAGAAALATAWSRGYAYPGRSGTLRGRFEFGTRKDGDDLWEGFEKLSGRFEIEGFRGLMNAGSGFGKARVEFDQAVTEAQHGQFESAIFDRFAMWAGRDFAGRGSFADRFAGSRIEEKPGRKGVFVVEGSTIREVAVEDGRVVAMLIEGWPLRRFGWSTSGNEGQVLRITTGQEVLSGRYAAVPGVVGLMLPVSMRFERVFGPDWGPETLELGELSFSADP
ncbi:MAG: hypothetical protein H6807_06450 [Planctomycetes bacterium]|nr:hypothetical protein [Planctomycetota bacterium]